MEQGDELDWLAEDLRAGLTEGAVAAANPKFSLESFDDGTILEVDLGREDHVYVVTVAAVPRLD